MFREMRRFKQVLSQEECQAILQRGSSGVLAVLGDGGYPYAVPLSYVYYQGRLYFHCAKSGHKLDAIAAYPQVSFCVVDMDEIVAEEFTTKYRSVVVFGQARILTEEGDKRPGFEALAYKYSPDEDLERPRVVERQLNNVCMIELTIEHLSGKQGLELMQEG